MKDKKTEATEYNYAEGRQVSRQYDKTHSTRDTLLVEVAPGVVIVEVYSLLTGELLGWL